MRPVCLIIRDGFGYSESEKGNAVKAADTPNDDAWREKYPWTLIDAAGEPVGLPPGFQGSSEVGHLNMGAGRIVVQELKRVDDAIRYGDLYNFKNWKKLIQNWKDNQSRLHLFGLLQDEGVHAYQEHLFAIMRESRKEYPEGEIIIHPFLDGRDTPPRSFLKFLDDLKEVMNEIGGCRIGTVMGRYYAMDRGEKWNLTDKAYHCLVLGEGRNAPTAEAAVKESYDNDRTPDGDEMVDEYIPPYTIGDFKGIKDGDSILHTNYRQDRAIQLSKAFVDPSYPGNLKEKPDVVYVGLTRYWDQFENYLIGGMEGKSMDNLVGEVISDAGMKQLRIAETQKFRHVTSFFNGKATTPYKGEDQVEVPSRFDPAMFASHPEMDAYTVTDKLLELLEDNPYHFIAVNYANCDMVGHTGNFEAAKKAVSIVDECSGKIVDRILELDGHVIVTADHGNADQMVEMDTGKVRTSHSTNPVELIYIAKDAQGKKLIQRGKLADIGVTIVYLLGLDIPEDMTADNIISEE